MSDQLSDEDIKKYLVTEKSDISTFSKEKINQDLEFIRKAEERSQKKADITMGVKDKKVSRAMSSLSLINPFKGV